MALSKTLDVVGINIQNAYIKVVSFGGDKNTISFSVSIAASADQKAFTFKEYQCDHDMAAGNLLEQSYDYLKTLPEFDGAIDC